MMGRQAAPEQLFYDFCLDDHVPDTLRPCLPSMTCGNLREATEEPSLLTFSIQISEIGARREKCVVADYAIKCCNPIRRVAFRQAALGDHYVTDRFC